MKTFKSFYDFYRLLDGERAAMIGTPFKERESDTIYFPIGLEDPWSNYGKTPGLIFVSPVWPAKKKYPKWFRVGVASPDDLDMNLDFLENECHLRPRIIRFLTEAPYGPWKNTSYDYVLKLVQEFVDGAGTMT